MAKNTITPEDIDREVQSEQFHVFPGSKTTFCLLTLRTGFEVSGTSACVDPANFDKTIGEHWARVDARTEVGNHLAFRLQDTLHAMREG